jgi:hypothetical protein
MSGPCFNVQYDQTPLEKLSIPKGKWTWNPTFTEMRAAKAWGVWPPSDFYKASKEDQAIAVTVYLDEMGIAAYQSKVDEAESRRKFKTSDQPDSD